MTGEWSRYTRRAPAAPRACAHPVQRPDERGRPTCGKCGADLIAEQAPLQRRR